MSNTSSKDTQLFGVVYQKLQTALFRRHKYAEMRLSSYLSARMNIDTWTFSSADIVNQTGLNRNTVYELCDGLVGAGIFSVKAERRGCATIYDFDKTALLDYLQGDTAIDGLGKGTCELDEHLPASSAGRSTCQLGEQVPASSTSTPCQLDRHPPASPLGTIIKIDNEEREKDIHTNRAYVSISLSQDAETKADEFIKKAKSLQSSSPEFGIIIKSNARNKLVDLFDGDPNLSVNTLGREWFNVLNLALLCKIMVHIDDPLNYAGTKLERGEFDEYFWFKRSSDLIFFINNRGNILAQLNLANPEYLDNDDGFNGDGN